MDKVLNATTPRQKIIEQITTHPPTDEDANSRPCVLPADHPLLEKFQIALKQHLLKVNAELTDEIAQLDHNIKKYSHEIEEVGANLYDYQEEIERQKDALEDYNNRLKEATEHRIKTEEHESIGKKQYDQLNSAYKNAQRVHKERLMELQHAQVLENNISRWTEEIESEVAAAKRVVSKDGVDQLAVSQQKKKMDLILFNLDEELRKGERQLAAVKEQLVEQTQTNDQLNGSISDANADLGALQLEQKRLIGAWNEVILAIKFRDKHLAKLRDDLAAEHQNHKVNHSSIDGTKKSAGKEMELNEKLETFKANLTNDIETLQSQLNHKFDEADRLTIKINTMTAVLEKTDSDLSKATIEGQITENQLKSLRRTLERHLEQKVQLEEETLELLQDQITTDQASSYRGKMLRETQEKRRQLELNMYGTEEQLSQMIFDLEKWKTIIIQDNDRVDKLATEQKEHQNVSDQLTSKINEVKTSINIKAKAYDLLNKQLLQLVNAAGGQEMDPNEIKLIALERSMTDIDNEIQEQQSFWLRLQGHIVHLTEKRSRQMNNIQLARKQLLVIQQKTLKIDAELDELKRQDNETTRKLKHMYSQLDSLNAKLYEKKKLNQRDEIDCSFQHAVLIDKLKCEEMSMLTLQQDIVDHEADIEQAKTIALERHREALSWESKWKLADETRRYRKEETAAASEIGIMKAEIHRMEVRLGQLRRAQDKLVADMESCVQHRDHIFDGANLRGKMPDNKTKTRFTIQHRLNDLKNKYKQANNEMSGIERSIGEVNGERARWLDEIKALEQGTEDERGQHEMIQKEIEQTALLKQENLEEIVRIQSRAKRYRSLLNVSGTQMPKCRSDTKLNLDMERQHEINTHLISVLDTLINEFPDHKPNIIRVLVTLRGNGE